MFRAALYALARARRLPATALVMVTPNLGACQPAAQSCEARASVDHVVRTDQPGKRLFVLSTESELLDTTSRARLIQEMASLVRVCYPDWGEDWGVSFFSDATLLGYKDEPALADHVASGQWDMAYLAEYVASERTLTISPAVPQRSRSLRIE